MRIDAASEVGGDANFAPWRTEGAGEMRRVLACMGSLLLATLALSKGRAAELPPVRIAYFVPSDREPIRDFRERLDRVMTEVQNS